MEELPRTKQRRSLVWAVFRALLLPVLAVAGSYAWLEYRYHSHPPRLTHNYAAELNARALAAPEAERAWAHYRAALLQINRELPPEFWTSDAYLHSINQEKLREEAAFRQNRELLPLIRAAAAMPTLGFILRDKHDPAELAWMIKNQSPEAAGGSGAPSDNPLLLTLLLPHLRELRSFVRWLQFDVQVAAHERDGSTAAADLIACFGIADQLREIPWIILDMESWRAFESSIVSLGAIVAEHPDLMNDAQLDAINRRLMAYAEGGPFYPRFSGERTVFADVVQRVYDPDDQFRPEIACQILCDKPNWWVKIGAPVSTHWYARRPEMIKRFEDLLHAAEAACTVPLWKCIAAPPRPGDDFSTDERTKFVLIWVFGSPPSKPYFLAQSAQQQRDAGLTVIALARYHLQSHRWPDDLDDLVPQFLPEIPPDRFTGEPLRYHVVNEKPIVYSVGADRDDDGGQPPPGKDGNEQAAAWVPPADASSAPDGDWVLWPAP